MPGSPHINRGAINGRAAFAGAAFLVGVGLTFVAERVGAPEALVRALGGLFALPGLALIGLLARSSRVGNFFVADRAAPSTYSGMAFAGIASGLALCLVGPRGAQSPLPLSGVALGLALGALVFGPAVRKANATAAADFFARRFGGGPLRWLLALVLLGVGALLGIAGFEAALEALATQAIVSRATAIAIVATTLALIVAPGGLAGVLWAAATCAGGIVLTLALPILVQALAAPGDPLAWIGAGVGSAGALGGIAPPVLILASALGVGALAPWAGVGAATPNATQALRAGASGILLVAVIAGGAALDMGLLAGALGPAASATRACALALAGLALAAAGLFSATQCLAVSGTLRIDVPRAPASQRLARARGAALILVALCGAALHARAVDPAAAILGAAVLSLAFVAPIFGLTFSPRATAIHALASLLVSLGALIVLTAPDPLSLPAANWLADGLVASILGFAAGWGASLFARPRPVPATNRSRDPFFEPPAGPLV